MNPLLAAYLINDDSSSSTDFLTAMMLSGCSPYNGAYCGPSPVGNGNCMPAQLVVAEIKHHPEVNDKVNLPFLQDMVALNIITEDEKKNFVDKSRTQLLNFVTTNPALTSKVMCYIRQKRLCPQNNMLNCIGVGPFLGCPPGGYLC